MFSSVHGFNFSFSIFSSLECIRGFLDVASGEVELHVRYKRLLDRFLPNSVDLAEKVPHHDEL